MRSLLALVVPAVLSFHLIACAGDDASNEQHGTVQDALVQEGGNCSQDSDCASGSCSLAQPTIAIGTRGKPAPGPCDDCEGDDDTNPTPAPTPKGKPLPAPEPPNDGNTHGGNPDPQPAPQPAPTAGICLKKG